MEMEGFKATTRERTRDMGGYRVCVYSVCKNEEKFVDRWVDSMSEADLIVVTDTGSTDKTVERLKSRGVIVYIDVIKPWRFDRARNSCLQHIPANVDICVSTDLDEVFEKGWRKKLEDAWTDDTKRASYHYTWSFNADGSPGITYMFDRIHARRGYDWVNPTHETLRYHGNGPEKFAWCPQVRLIHYPDRSKDRSFNLPLLELAVKERPEDPRNYHYLGREYLFAGRWDSCIETLKKHLALPNCVWKAERCASMRFIARAYKAKGNLKEAKSWLYRAIAEAPGLREPYLESARIFYEEKNWIGVHFMAEEALKIAARSTYINDAQCWDGTLYDLNGVALYYLGLREKALVYANKALNMSPKDKRLIKNVELIRNSIRDEQGKI